MIQRKTTSNLIQSTRRPFIISSLSSKLNKFNNSRSISTIRARRLATSTFFTATFLCAFLTVGLSASTLLPCPAKNNNDSYKNMRAHEEEEAAKETGNLKQEVDRNALIGQRLQLGRKGGWIEIEHKR